MSMKRFERGDEGISLELGGERLRAFHKSLFDALRPLDGEPVSVHGELLRAFTWPALRIPFPYSTTSHA